MTVDLVTQGAWSVSAMTGDGIKGARLSVFREFGRRFLRGDGNGLLFPSVDAAMAWALEHGYLQRFYRGPWCRDCRVRHTFLGKPSGFCHALGKFVGDLPPPSKSAQK